MGAKRSRFDQTKRIGVFGDFYQARKAIWLILQRGGYLKSNVQTRKIAVLRYVTLRYVTRLHCFCNKITLHCYVMKGPDPCLLSEMFLLNVKYPLLIYFASNKKN